jgi:hypothetical protein
MKFWIGVASRDHVAIGRAGGFCQLNHGKEAPLRRLSGGDRIVFYSPRTAMKAGEPLQAFTAIGEVLPRPAYRADMGNGFHPFRRDVAFLSMRETPIRPLLQDLSFTRGRPSWGYAFRRGYFEISLDDYAVIAWSAGVNVKPELELEPQQLLLAS